ncbi:MAG TPA: HEAT repeat domain-containing protein, partial [Planctomycetota bacterium]|nr:HEAT repeat domain-containing protein [Planctomycetota bacterium]
LVMVALKARARGVGVEQAPDRAAKPGASTTARTAVPGGPTADVPPEADADAPAPRPDKDAAPSAVPLSPEQIAVLLQSKDRKEAERGVKAIEKIVDPALKMALLRQALASPVDRARERALDLLRKIGGPEAAELVAQALRSDPEDDVRRRAARYLGELGGPSALAALQEAAGSLSLELQVVAVSSLNRLGHAGPMHLVIQKLGGMLDHPDGALREDAVGHLDDLRTPAAIPQLSRALRDTDSDIRRNAVEALEDLGTAEVIPLLEQALRDPNPRVAREAARAIERLRAPKEGSP